MNHTSRFILGVTGGIGCGKTTVCRLFLNHGVEPIDTDEVAHTLTGPNGAAMPALRAEFGEGCVAADGSLDRAAMRAQVFSDPQAKRRLEAILHPMIRAAVERQALAAGGPYTVVVVPLLFESGTWRDKVDRVLVIDCPEERQIERVIARSGLSEAQIRAIMATQIGRQERIASADDIILNDGSPEDLPDRLAQLHHTYLDAAREKFARCG